MDVHQRISFPIRCSSYELGHGMECSARIARRGGIIEFVHIMHEASAVLVVEKDLPLLNSAVECMIQLRHQEII